jgi:DNA-binding NarL/FixJ family response regulator
MAKRHLLPDSELYDPRPSIGSRDTAKPGSSDVVPSRFLLKDASRERLLEAIRVVHHGDALLSPSITRRLVEDFAARTDPLEPPSRVLEQLTPRERQVLALVARGHSNSEIAQRLVVTEATVKSHVGSFLSKLALRDRIHAVVFAYDHGIVVAGDPG